MMAIAQKIVDYSSNSSALRGDEISNTISSLAAWKEFQAGMQILQRYASRSSADVHAVAKSNLQLLHRSLSFNALYRSNIESIQHEGAKIGLPRIRRLYADQGFTADLLTLQDGASMKLITSPQQYTMYLLISGNALLNAEGEHSTPEQHWWNRIGTTSNKNQLRNGASIIFSDNKQDRKLTANGKNLLFLRINTSTMTTPCKMAS